MTTSITAATIAAERDAKDTEPNIIYIQIECELFIGISHTYKQCRRKRATDNDVEKVNVNGKEFFVSIASRYFSICRFSLSFGTKGGCASLNFQYLFRVALQLSRGRCQLMEQNEERSEEDDNA